MFHKESYLFQTSFTDIAIDKINEPPFFEFTYSKKIIGVNQRMTFNFKTKRLILNPSYRKSVESLRKFVITKFLGSKTYKKVIVSISTQRNKQDIDACIKPILDAMEGIVFENDKQVEFLTVNKSGGEFGFIVRVWEV
ncbi:MAG: RusA family crossover junction endodeoxyribonuclease [Candidatus Diapherotrites archaeon]